VVREGVRYAAPRAEHGWDHSLATLADCLRMSLFFDESLRALPVIQGLSARFLASPKRERFVFQSTLDAITTLRGLPKPESDQVRPA